LTVRARLRGEQHGLGGALCGQCGLAAGMTYLLWGRRLKPHRFRFMAAHHNSGAACQALRIMGGTPHHRPVVNGSRNAEPCGIITPARAGSTSTASASLCFDRRRRGGRSLVGGRACGRGGPRWRMQMIPAPRAAAAARRCPQWANYRPTGRPGGQSARSVASPPIRAPRFAGCWPARRRGSSESRRRGKRRTGSEWDISGRRGFRYPPETDEGRYGLNGGRRHKDGQRDSALPTKPKVTKNP